MAIWEIYAGRVRRRLTSRSKVAFQSPVPLTVPRTQTLVNVAQFRRYKTDCEHREKQTDMNAQLMARIDSLPSLRSGATNIRQISHFWASYRKKFFLEECNAYVCFGLLELSKCTFVRDRTCLSARDLDGFLKYDPCHTFAQRRRREGAWVGPVFYNTCSSGTGEKQSQTEKARFYTVRYSHSRPDF